MDGLSDDAGIAGFDPMEELVRALSCVLPRDATTLYNACVRIIVVVFLLLTSAVLGCQGIPKDQRPVNELKALRDNGLYSWVWTEIFNCIFKVVLGNLNDMT